LPKKENIVDSLEKPKEKKAKRPKGASVFNFASLENPDYNVRYVFYCIGRWMKVDPELNNGPLSESRRKCTDFIFGILVVLYTLGMIAVAIYGFVKGNPYKLLSPTDDDGKF
jgi:hypothetical protein